MNSYEPLKLDLDRVDCAIQVNPGDGWDNKEVALDKGEIKHHDTIVNY